VIAGCCELFKLKAENAEIEILTDLAKDLPDIIADKRALKQIMINLLSNAIKFTDRGGRVKVSAEIDGSDIVISVEDNGIGIKAEDLRRVGDPFFQADDSYDRRHYGTGLGLSIVKGLVALHCGNFSAQSRPAAGTRITVRLPIDCERARAEREINRDVEIVHQLQPETGRTIEPALQIEWEDNNRAVKISA
jgi:cell cycle sensor histidine kinase DivJ